MRRRWVALGSIAFLIVWLGGTFAIVEWRNNAADTEAAATRCAGALNFFSGNRDLSGDNIGWQAIVQILLQDCDIEYPLPTLSN